MVVSATGEEPSVRADGEGHHCFVCPPLSQNFRKPALCREGPEDDPALVPCTGQPAACGVKNYVPNLLTRVVALKSVEQFAGLGIEQYQRATLAAGGDPVAIGADSGLGQGRAGASVGLFRRAPQDPGVTVQKVAREAAGCGDLLVQFVGPGQYPLRFGVVFGTGQEGRVGEAGVEQVSGALQLSL
jgi:hypothetical protein